MKKNFKNNEKIVETKICKHCNSNFEITDKDMEFYEKFSPVFAGKKYNISTPIFCPDCRQQRRLSFRNERKLYKRKCDATGKDIVSIYSPDKKYKVYNSDYWWSDKWDAMDYGIKFDFSKGFFEQFGELLNVVPKISLYGNNNENSDYTNDTINNKNCYLIFASDYSENCLYGVFGRSKDSMDCLEVSNMTNSYECINCDKSTNLFFSGECNYCSYSSYLINCDNCEYCFLSSNIKNKKYFILNKQYSKEEYFKKIKEYSLKDCNKLFNNLLQKTFYKNLSILNSENCFGNYISNSKDCYFCFDIIDANNCSYIYFGSQKLEDCMDCIMSSINASKCYEVQTCLENCHSIISCNFCNNISFSYYLDSCINCSNCFGCAGLRYKSYCIFNKQYTKEEYEILVPQIIEHMKKSGEWGEFFPSNISPFGYNETGADEYFPLIKESAIKKGFNRSDFQTPFPKVEKIISANKLPNNINDVPDDILNWAIECEITNKPFKVIKLELDFYRKHNLPIPKRHPDQRHLDRMNMRNPRKLFDRKCDKCGIDMKTTYSPEMGKIVYCEECYNKAVY